MGLDVGIQKCAYSKCSHGSKSIDTGNEEYIVIDETKYYHIDCYEKVKITANVRYIKDKWMECISDTVVWNRLVKMLYSYINRGISSDYLVFVLDYVISHKLPLHQPEGFRYYVDKYVIKEGYKKEQLKKQNIPKPSDFIVEDAKEQPKIGYKIGKRRSFEDILK